MKHAIAIWNYSWDAEGVVPWIAEFAKAGFDAISFNPKPFAGDAVRHLAPVSAALDEHNLAATVHGDALTDRDLWAAIVDAFGDRLDALTMDPLRREESRGVFYDAERIRAALACLQDLTSATEIRIAVEDFPLDETALSFYSDALGDVYDHPRTGILVDVGHMHIRMQMSDAFKGVTVQDYFRCLPLPLVEVHLHDNDGRRDQHGHFGMGTVPFDAVADALKAIAFDGVCTIEIAPGFHKSTPAESKFRALESLATWRRLMGRLAGKEHQARKSAGKA